MQTVCTEPVDGVIWFINTSLWVQAVWQANRSTGEKDSKCHLQSLSDDWHLIR